MLKETLKAFYGDLSGKSTDEVYKEYCKRCKEAGIEPRMKSIVIRELCVLSGNEVKEVRKKFFV